MTDETALEPIRWTTWLGGFARLLCLPVVFIWPSGDWGWPQGWALAGVWVAYSVFMGLWLAKNDPELLRSRLDARPAQEGQASWDKVLMIAMLITGLALIAVPPLDHRWGWSTVPTWLEIAGLLANIPAFVFVSWVMMKNTFLARVVKIDAERGHTVITDGPYAIVRHPMYLGVLLAVFATPLALGSWWGLIPAAAMNAALVVRTVLEDRMLHEELDGYREYAQQTRYRLVPGVF